MKFSMRSKRPVSVLDARSLGTHIGIDWTKIALKQFWRGIEVELEQGTHDPDTSVNSDELILMGKVVWAHLEEISNYYVRLDTPESKSEGLGD